MKRFHARRAVIEALKELGLYVDAKENPMTIPICSFVGYHWQFFVSLLTPS